MTPVVLIASVAALGWIFGVAVGVLVGRSWERRRLARQRPVYTVQVGRRRWWDGIP